MNIDNRLEELIINRLHDQLSPQEEEEYQELLRQNPTAISKIESFQNISSAAQQFKISPPDTNTAFKQLRKRQKSYQIRQWSKYAAILLLPLCIGSYFFIHAPNKQIEPGSTGVILETADGKTMNLSDIKNTLHIHREHVALSATEKGELSYTQHSAPSATAPDISKITIPKGHYYKLQLCDGTIVRLNSATQLSYPEVFAKHERRVSISGEALFEVKPEDNRPFIVETAGMQIKVMGTIFNVNTYQANQPSATLIEGKIKAVTATDSIILSPGEMVCINNQQLEIQTVDTAKITSWVNGKLFFSDTRLENIIENICRWYDLETIWHNDALKNSKVTGVIRRDLPVASSLDMLEKIVGQGIRFQLDGKIIEISQK